MKKKLLGIILALCMLLSLCACGGGNATSTPDAAPSSGAAETPDAPEAEGPAGEGEAAEPAEPAERVEKDELIVGTTNDVTVPFENFVNNNIIGIGLCYDYLVYMDQDTNEMVSDILEDWYVEDDNVTYVLKIKPGVTFTNGEELNAYDIIYSFQERINQAVAQIEAAMNFDWDNAEVSDDGLTLTIKSFSEYAPGISVLNTFPIESKVQHETYGLDDEIWYTSTCGTGPYKLVEQVTGSHATYELRDDYWDDTQYMFKTVTVKHYGDETALYTDFQNGNVDIAMALSAFSYQQLESGAVENAVVKLQSQGNYIWVSGNYNNDLWNDDNFRLAIAHAIDWDAMNITGFDGLGVAMDSIFPSNCVGYESQGAYEYDLDLAKQYLADSIYDGSNLSILVRDRSAAAAEALNAMLTELGVSTTLDTLEFANYLSKMGSGDYDLLIAEFNTDNSGEPSKVYSSIGTDSNTAATMVVDQEWNDLVAAASTVDEAARAEALAQMQVYAKENVIVVPLMDRYEVWAYNSTVLPADYNCYYGGYTIFAVEAE